MGQVVRKGKVKKSSQISNKILMRASSFLLRLRDCHGDHDDDDDNENCPPKIPVWNEAVIFRAWEAR